MSSTGIGRNAAWNVVESLATSLVLFVLYKLILASLGLSALGIWSLVLATTSLARIADLGAAGGLGRYIALCATAENSERNALRYLETAFLTNALFYGGLSALVYWPAWYALGFATHGSATQEARALLPYAIGSFALMNVANVATAALIGLHKSYQKSIIAIFTMAIQAIVAALLVGKLGLRAVALGQVAQYSFVALIGWVLAVRHIEGEWRFHVPHRLDRPALRELVGFGLRLQLLNIAAFPFEPLTKFVFSSVGGLPALGLYELASRGFLQVRQLVVAPSQNLTPLFAAQHQMGGSGLEELYEKATTAMVLAGCLAMGGLAVGAPLISLVWLGRVDPMFVVYSLILACGWFINIASTPGYFLGVGTGKLRWNLLGAAISTLSAGLLGILLGLMIGPAGIAVGAMVGIGAGGIVTWSLNCRELRFRMLPKAEAWHGLRETIRVNGQILTGRLV